MIRGWLRPKPGRALDDIPFAERPHIVARGNHFFLRYRVAVPAGGPAPRSALVAKRTPDKGYYFFSMPISHPEFGNLVERPLAYDGFTDLARRNAMYWLNPDGSEIHLEHSEESDGTAQ